MPDAAPAGLDRPARATHGGRLSAHRPTKQGSDQVKDVHSVRMVVNGADHELAVESRRTLADVLRHDLGYTGTGEWTLR